MNCSLKLHRSDDAPEATENQGGNGYQGQPFPPGISVAGRSEKQEQE
jgi:hypothetical protein